MGRIMYRSRKISIFLILMLLFQGISSSMISVASAATFTINNTDSYAGVMDKVDPKFRIYQMDGASTAVKASVNLNLPTWVTGFNGVAVSKDNYIYIMAQGTSGTTTTIRILKIDSAGTVVGTFNPTLTTAPSAAATMIGSKYYYIVDTTLYYYDVSNNQQGKVNLINDAGAPLTGLGADLVADSDGYLWVSQQDNLLQINPATGGIIRALPVPGLSTQLSVGVRAMSFLVDGRIMLTSNGYNEINSRFTVDEEGKLTRLADISGIPTTTMGVIDLGSAVFPKFEPFPPAVESKKEFKILKKGTGTKVDQVQAGDTLVYTVQARNTKAAPSILKGLSITDTIPAGLEYVPGTLMVDKQSMSDAADTDKGEVVGGKVTGKIGDVINTDYHTIEFQVKVLAGNDEKTILNKADVTSLNADPQQPTAEFVVQPLDPPVTPVPPANSCGQLGRVALVNGSFEQPYYTSIPSTSYGPGYFIAPAGTVPGWKTTDSNQVFELFNKTLMDKIQPGSVQDQVGLKNAVPHGEQFAELNSREAAQLYQDVQTTPGQTIYWRLAHKGRQGTDTMALKIGPSAVSPKDLPTIQQMTTGKDQWKYYTGTYKVPEGQTTTRFGFEAISSAGGDIRAGNFLDDIFLGTEPCVSATKSVSPEGQVKAGDELTYKVTVKNDGGDIAAKSIFTDAIPAGTEYVPGSIQVTKNAKTDSVTDGKDTDAGYYQDGKVTVDLGDLPNTDILPDGVTVQFKVKALSSDVKQQIKNKANVAYKNLLTNTDGTVDTNEVVNDVEPEPETPTPPPNSCGQLGRVSLINGSFEEGPARGSYDINQPFMFLESEVPGWLTTDKSQGVKIIEIWDYKQGYPTVVKDYPAPPDGNRYAELNAYENGLLYQDIKTTPGQTIYWRFSHMGREGTDKMQLRIGPSTNNPYDTVVQQQMSDGNTAWGTYAGTYKVPEGQTVTRFGFEAVSTANGILGAGNFLDDIFLGTEPCVSATKSVSPEGQVKAGDELTYKVTVKNDGGDIAAKSIFTDAIPAGTEYVPGSIQVTKNAKTDSITDGKDTDSGYYQDGKVTVDLGDLPNTDILPDGVTVQFKVKVLSGYVNQQIKNKANVAYKNLLTNTDGTVETNEVVNNVIPNEAKVESKKIAKNLQDKNIEVGDEIEYTIQMRNTISDSIVKNAVIEDQLPEGLEYVPGTLQVDGKAVTDTEGDDNGHYLQGKATGKLGDITDTEWHSVTFHAKVKADQAGKSIQNKATVTGEGVPPQEPTTTVEVSTPETPTVPPTNSCGPLGANSQNITSASLDMNSFKAMAAGVGQGITMNNKDYYAPVTDNTGTMWIYQYDGNNPSHIPIGAVKTNLWIDGLGMSLTEGVFYGSVNGSGIHRIYPDGTSKLVVPISDGWNVLGAGATTPDGAKFTFHIVKDNLSELRTLDLKTGIVTTMGSFNHGFRDILYDSKGDLYFIRDTDDAFVRLNPETKEEAVIGKFQLEDGSNPITWGSGLNFLPDGRVLISDFYGALYFGSLESNQLTPLGQADVYRFWDTASACYPTYAPELKIEKFIGEDLTENTVYRDDVIKYTLKVSNSGNISADGTIVKDLLPEGTEYIQGTTTLNGQNVNDIDGQSPLFTEKGLLVKSPSSAAMDGSVLTGTENTANVTFQVKVKNDVESGKKIPNIANVTSTKNKMVESNKVTSEVIYQKPVLVSEKKASIANKAEGNTDVEHPEVGDEIKYTIQMRNTISDSIVKNAVIEDQLPEGLEYVPGTLQVNGKPVTDTEGDDTGHYVQGKFTGQLGDITDTEWHTVVFHAKVKAGQAGQDIQNTAKVTGENVPPQEPSTTVEVYPRNPKVESKKTAKNLQDKNIEVGDEIEYTIQMRNTISDSIVKNAVIEDQLPEALEYVPGTLQVNGQSVTDAEGDDTGHYIQGKVTGQLGDITDTEWHTVVFHAKVKAGQEGTAIQNIAKVTGEDVPPQEPTTEIKVQPLGQIEIEKVDAADSTIKLKNAVFQIIDKDGKEVGKLTTDENGKTTSELLLLGKYTIK
ncbi:isopeptide-forming domain-containing fimbrial protein, partial [Bacillus sp. SN10]|uniref:isopeptide-forming domain-containing fimbrial protein n=1 Tax=Bacillus sp. SN10 TaxID=2056493 RepID=UPI000C326FF8